MKPRNLALFVSTVIVSNMIGLSAMAAGAKVSDELIDQSIAAQSTEMRRSLDQINALIKSIETYRTQSGGEKQNAFMTGARLMIAIMGITSTAVHLNNIQAQSSAELTLAAFTGVLSTALEKYASTQKIDMNEIKTLLAKNQQELVNSIAGANKQEAALISGAVAQLSQISTGLDSQMNDIKRTIDSGQTDVAIVAIVTLALHYAAPFLPQKLKDIVSNKVPTLLGQVLKTKKQGMQALGGVNIATLLSTLAGMAGKDSQAQIDTILSNLWVTQANMTAALK